MRIMRIQEMEKYIYNKKTVTLNELCSKFEVSKNTIRRDLKYLEKKNIIKKVYGGVTTNENYLTSFEQRTNYYKTEKEKIGHCASKFIEEGDIIFIDSGTTTNSILSNLNTNINLTLLTNSLDIIISASYFDNINLFIIGNNYKRETKSFIGVNDLSALNNFNIDKAFMSATGVTLDQGLTNSDIIENKIKKTISKKSNSLYLLADKSKFGKYTLLTYAQMEDLDAIITSEPLSDDYISFCQENKIAIRVIE